MLSKPRDFGFSVGRFQPLTTDSMQVSLESGGVDRSVSAAQLNEGGSPNAVDVRFIGGGIATEYGVSNLDVPYSADPNRSVMHIAPYELEDDTEFLMRIRTIGVDRWNGANWLTLPGTLTGSVLDRIYSTVQSNRFIFANGIDRIKAWDGDDVTGITDLSPDAPVAYYITRIGTRLLAARLRDIGGTLRPNLLAWSADDNIFEWTDPNLGAGQAEPIPEGSGRKANFITGLSTLARGAVIYRQAAIQLGILTGQGAAPFRFSTVDFNHGTDSPYSIANGGIELGDFFLGSDFMPYNFKGDSIPIPIGGPIHDELQRVIPDLQRVVGVVDTNEQQYWLTYPTDDTNILTEGWVFDIRKFATKQANVWRRRTLPNPITLGFGNVVVTNDPIVDTVGTTVESDPTRVDVYGRNTGYDRLMFGDSNGQVTYRDHAVPLTSGSWMSKQFLHPNGHNVTVDRTRIRYISPSGATVALSVSTDGGSTFSSEKFLTLVATSTIAGIRVAADHRVTGSSFIVRIRSVTGFVTVTELEVTFQNLGQTNE